LGEWGKVIRVENLTKYYGSRLAADNISFSVGKGEVVGLLGPNAAGKTTTMRILTGYLTPTSGSVWIAGADMIDNSLEARRHIGYLPESVPLYDDMSVRFYLDFNARLKGLDGKRRLSRIKDVIDICRLGEYADTLIRKLSKGFRQRVGIAQAIIHEPDVLILDEPTISIDPRQVVQTRELIKELGKERAVILATHILPEASMTCERVVIINEGKIVAMDRIEKLSSTVGGARRLRLEVEGPPKQVVKRLEQIEGVSRISREGLRYIVECTADRDLRAELTEAIVQSGWNLLSLESMTMSLEDIFLKLTTEDELSQ